MVEKISYKLEVFEGPLDLLLHLIEKNKIDIRDIPINMLLSQYLEYVEEYKSRNLDTVSDFINMASTLLLIKSRILLPKHEEEEEDPREELVDLLTEYKKYKLAAKELQSSAQSSAGQYVREPEELRFPATYTGKHKPEELSRAYQRLSRRVKGKMPPPASTFTAYVASKVVSVGSRVYGVLKLLLRQGQTCWSSLFVTARSRSEIVATFLAVLELSKVNRIWVEETEGEPVVLLRRK